ncbi:MAG: hypothetical protein KDK90_26700 [Leptospiraceae bacterium]|nr:hypothetical protein [Leptospiraceae bacterium]
MAQIKDFFLILKRDYQVLGDTIKSYLNNYNKAKAFFKDLFHWIPADFFILLFFTIILVVLLNSISRRNPKFNLFLSFFVTSASWLSLSTFLGYSRYTHIFISMVILVTFMVVFYLLDFGISYFFKYIYKKRIGNPRTLERSMYNLQSTYNESMAQAYLLLSETDYNLPELKERLTNLKIASEGMITLLEKRYKQ